MDSSIVPYLFGVTLVIALLFGIVQLIKVNKAKREHHRSAEAKAHHEPPTSARS